MNLTLNYFPLHSHVNCIFSLFFNPQPEDIFPLISRERKGERQRETSIWDTSIGCLLHMPHQDQGLSLQLRYNSLDWN